MGHYFSDRRYIHLNEEKKYFYVSNSSQKIAIFPVISHMPQFFIANPNTSYGRFKFSTIPSFSLHSVVFLKVAAPYQQHKTQS